MTIIKSAEVIVTSPGRNFVTLQITTEDGTTGLGDATLNGRELAVAVYLADHVIPLLKGRDAMNIEDTWQYLYRGAYWRRGPVTMAAIAAVDMALWDIKAKVAELPMYQLLGGQSRTGALAYGHASGRDTEELHDSIRANLEAGFKAIRVQSGIPGADSVYGVHSNAPTADAPATPAGARASRVLPEVETWDTRAYLRHVPTEIESVRHEFGAELPLLHDAHHRLTPREAAQLGRSLEPFDLFWLEDVTPIEDPTALRYVREHTTTPLAIGEVLNSVHDYQTLVTERLVDYVRSAVTHTGGITHLKKLADFASIYGVRTGFHGPTDVSPVGQAAHLHLDLALHNFGIQEYMIHSEATAEVFETSFRFEDGLLHPGERIGLGVEIDREAARRHAYEPGYLPVARLHDGSVHDW
ncbi:D-mannonate dehydratase ManD [Demequina sp.]|uniref:D-mannonate dehydratase ManD n=1 Tax=Demequina sp. TaxID=2050685 RepID=UPI003A8637FA